MSRRRLSRWLRRRWGCWLSHSSSDYFKSAHITVLIHYVHNAVTGNEEPVMIATIGPLLFPVTELKKAICAGWPRCLNLSHACVDHSAVQDCVIAKRIHQFNRVFHAH